MDETALSINQKNSILLSRNKPVALVVGAAGFLGSHLVDTLLEKGIQVIGIDNLASGKKDNLRQAIEDKNFHLVIEEAQKLDLDLERLDYLFIVAAGQWNLNKILGLFKQTKCRCLFVSSIDLYERDNRDDLSWRQNTEGKLAKFATEYNLNARVLRLGPVYGPRMDFQKRDPVIRLIQQALTGNLQNDITLEFSSRALYVADAVDLMIRTIFAGSTAQKIFDGVLPAPVKVAEIQQVLLDPVWYERRDFNPSPLPPWTTPNLEKTIKTLNWHPKHHLVSSLRKTLSYFKDNEIKVPELEVSSGQPETGEKESEDTSWKEDKKEQLEGLKSANLQKIPKPKLSLPLAKIYLILVIALVTYALIWPAFIFGWGIVTFQNQLNQGLNNLQKGDLENSLINIKQASAGMADVKSTFATLEPVRKAGLFKHQFEAADRLVSLSELLASATGNTALGISELLQSIRAMTGEKTESPAAYFTSAQVKLSSADIDLAQASALLKAPNFSEGLPDILKQKINELPQKLDVYSGLVSRARAISVLLPKLSAVEGSKEYLITLQNNMELRPAGGFIGSFAKVSFESGKLKKLEVNDTYAIDGQLGIHVEPPKEIKEDLGQKDWFLRDSNWEPDFPTSARQAEWFYAKETGNRVAGVIALDISAMQYILASAGPLDLPDYGEEITSENLFENAVTYAETGFFPGSQAKKSFLTALTNALFNKLFFVPQNNWPGVISALGKGLEEKHISIYLDDPKLFSYVDTQGWAHVLPRQSKENQGQDFLSLVEANLGANKVNYYLDRNYNLETVIGKDGEVKHRMRVGYTNKSPSEAFPGGKYKNRLRVYLPFGSKLTRVLWGESDITKNATSFVDYGRTGYSLLLELAPKEQKNLVLDYQVPVKLEFNSGKAAYRLDIIKQAGTLKDPLEWTMTYPISYQLVSDQAKAISPQQFSISTDLSRDRSFEVEFKK